ncbi:MAG TPA: CAP domain-containing protein [Candidatus Binataceae bacterium]|nr:CAP domain-containing protein [Candidatus Binataceae bacterium]
MRESSASGRGQTGPGRQRGVVIQMPTPKVVRQRRAVRAGMALLGLALAGAIAARIYLNTSLPHSVEQIAGVSSEETRILDLVNVERAKAGRAALKLSGRLAVAARGHSYDMALRHYFSHSSADGVSPEQRIRGSGIDYLEVGENIYMETYPDHEWLAERAVQGWLGSPGHRKNMLSPAFTDAGVGLARAADGSTYVTQDFIRK